MKLLTVSAAARVLDIPANTLLARIHRGALRVARRDPLRVRLADVVAYHATMPPVRPYGGRPRVTDRLVSKLARALQEN